MATAAPRTTRARKPKAEATPEAKTDAALTEYTDDKGKRLTVQQLKNKLRGQAERAVLDKYKNEVVHITEGLYKEHNLEYVRRLTDEEKAAKEMLENIGKYPGLLDLLAPAVVARVAQTQGVDVAGADEKPETDEAWEARKRHLAELAAAEGIVFDDTPQVEQREGE